MLFLFADVPREGFFRQSVIKDFCRFGRLKGFVDVARSAAFGRVAGDVFEFAFPEAGGALFRNRRRFENIAAFPAFPERLSASGTNIVLKRCIRLITAVCTFFDCHTNVSFDRNLSSLNGNHHDIIFKEVKRFWKT